MLEKNPDFFPFKIFYSYQTEYCNLLVNTKLWTSYGKKSRMRISRNTRSCKLCPKVAKQWVNLSKVMSYLTFGISFGSHDSSFYSKDRSIDSVFDRYSSAFCVQISLRLTSIKTNKC